MTDERMEMLLKESFVNIRPGAELQEKLLQRLYAQEQVLTGRQQGNRYNLRRWKQQKWGEDCPQKF